MLSIRQDHDDKAFFMGFKPWIGWLLTETGLYKNTAKTIKITILPSRMGIACLSRVFEEQPLRDDGQVALAQCLMTQACR